MSVRSVRLQADLKVPLEPDTTCWTTETSLNKSLAICDTTRER
jgi:hypothetical protein